jgi:hypothetical protein
LSSRGFEIEVNGVFLDLPDSALRYEVVNPMFESDLYQGDYSFPFELPATPKNVNTLLNANRVEVKDRVTEFSCTLYIFGKPKFNPKLTVKRGSLRTISVVLNGGIRSLSNANKKLKEVVTGEYNLGNTHEAVYQTATAASQEGAWSAYGFTFVPFYAPNFYGSANPNFCGVVNRVNSTTGDILANDLSVVNNKYTLVPWLFLFYILNRIFEELNLEPTGSFWEDKELQTLLLFNNKTIDARPINVNSVLVQPKTSLGYIVMNASGQRFEFVAGPRGPGIWDGPEDEILSFDNIWAWDPAADEYEIKLAGTFSFSIMFKYSIRPGHVDNKNVRGGKVRMYVDGVLYQEQEIFSRRGLHGVFVATWDIAFLAGDIGKTVHFEWRKPDGNYQAATETLVYNGRLEVSIQEANPALTPYGIVKYHEHVPDWTVAELLVEVKKLGVHFDFEEQGKVKMELFNRIIEKNSFLDCGGKPAPDYDLNLEDKNHGVTVEYEFGSDDEHFAELDVTKYVGEFSGYYTLPTAAKEGWFALALDTNRMYQVVKNQSSGINEWLPVGNYVPKYTYGDGNASHKLRLAPMKMCIFANEGGTTDENEALMPYYTGQGVSEMFSLNGSHEPRLLFWRGLNQAGSAETVLGGIYVLATPYLYGINENLVGQYSLLLHTDESLVRTICESFFTALTNGEVIEKDMQLDPAMIDELTATCKILADYNLHLAKSISIEVTKYTARAKAYGLKL